MGEQRHYERVSPGQKVKVTLSAVHAQARMGPCGVEFRHEESGALGIIAEGELTPTGRRFSHPSGVAWPVSEVKIEIEVPRMEPGIYKVARIWAESFGGTPFQFEGEELYSAADIGFEVLAEPDTKPAMDVRVTRTS